MAHAEAGQSATFCLRVHDSKSKLRRGMVLMECRYEAGSSRPSYPSGAVTWELETLVTVRMLLSVVAAMWRRGSRPPCRVPVRATPSGAAPFALSTVPHTRPAPAWVGMLKRARALSEQALRLPLALPVRAEMVLHCAGVKQAVRLLEIADAFDGTTTKLVNGSQARLRLRCVQPRLLSRPYLRTHS